MEKFKVTFYPDNKTVEVEKDRTILSAALSAGVYINSACGGDGVCARCRVILRKGEVSMLPSAALSPEDRKKGVYLACVTFVLGDCEVEIPPESRVNYEHVPGHKHDPRLGGFFGKAQDVPAAELSGDKDRFPLSPLTEKIFLKIRPPDIDDHISDLDRLYRAISEVRSAEISHISLMNVRSLGEILRSSGWEVTVTLGVRSGIVEAIQVEAGDRSERNFGFVFDIGTTTVSGQLVDLGAGRILGTKATYNKQASFGADVITRIMYAQKGEGLVKLHAAVLESVNGIIHDLIEEHGVDRNDVTAVLCAGNTTMIHLLLSIDPSSIRKEPYVPAASNVPVIRAHEAGIAVNPHGLLYCVPGVASYVGGDVTAGVLSCGLDMSEQTELLIDIGTNGEIALGCKDFIVATAASAGPAFEGSGVSCGMRSSAGAIQKVCISGAGKLSYETIGGAKPVGICGSGYIDCIAAMLSAGILDKDGKINPAAGVRLKDTPSGKIFVLVPKNESASSNDIFVSEADIENIMRAKAAIYAATMILLKKMSFDIAGVNRVFIAGGFGTSLDVGSAVGIGLLPDIDPGKYVFIGNSSLSGARAQLFSRPAFETARGVAQKMTYLELSVEPGYMDEYMAALFFPHTDLNRFPSFKQG